MKAAVSARVLVAVVAVVAVVALPVAAHADEGRAAPPPTKAEPEHVPISEDSVKFSLGGFYGALFGISDYGGVGTLSVGGPTKPPVITYLTIRLGGGRTDHGLGVQFAQVGFSPDMVLADRFRVGAEATVGYFRINAVTNQSDLDTASFGLAVNGSYDVIRFSPTDSLYVAPRLGFDFVEQKGPPWFTAALSLGYRWDSASRR